MSYESHTVSTADNVSISFDHYHQSMCEAVVIVCHGFFQSKETPTFRRMSEALAGERDVVAMDFRGHGRSEGFYAFSAYEGQDLEAVLRWAGKRYARIGIIGFSLGGAIAINTASRRPEKIHSLIAVSAPAVFEEIEFHWWTLEAMRAGIQGLEPGVGCRPGRLFLAKDRPIERIAGLSDTPVLFMHGTRDPIVGEGHSHRLYAAAKEPKRLEIIKGGGHAQMLFRDNPEGFLRFVNDWFRKTLPGPLAEAQPA